MITSPLALNSATFTILLQDALRYSDCYFLYFFYSLFGYVSLPNYVPTTSLTLFAAMVYAAPIVARTGGGCIDFCREDVSVEWLSLQECDCLTEFCRLETHQRRVQRRVQVQIVRILLG